MAQRRMFSKVITNSGKFLKMPSSSRLLYYDLGMNADDDGFAEWYTVIKMTGATEQDMQVLQANGFVKVFDDNVLIILDWKENNYIPKDRYSKSKYAIQYEVDLKLANITTGFNPCIQDVYKMDTQVRLGKVRLGKDNNKNKKILFWKEQKCHISPVNGKIGMYDQGEWKELNENYPEDCKLIDPNGEVLAIGYDAITQFKK